MTSSDSTASDPDIAGKSGSAIEPLALRDQFALAEYNNLRMEIVKMIELQSQLTNLTVIAFGAIVSVGFEARNSAILAIHPVLALILGICWLNHAYAIVRAADYIRSKLEVRFFGNSYEGWEHFVVGYKIPHARIGYLGVRLIFPGSSILAVISTIYVGGDSLVNFIATVVAAVVAVMTIALFLAYREPSPGIKL